MRKIFTEHFMRGALIVVAISTAIFTLAQYISFLITSNEQTELISMWFTVVGVEIGGCIVKKSIEIVSARIKKKENLKEDDSDDC